MFRPEVDGKSLTFIVVGARYYNAILEDTETGTWWWQATGKAEVGPLAGEQMEEVPFDMTTLAEWLALHPDSDVLQPDPAIGVGYQLFDFHEMDENKPSRDDERYAAGEMREWVVVVRVEGAARAYPWFHLEDVRLIQDEIGGVPIALHLLEDGVSFRAWDRRLDAKTLAFRRNENMDVLVDVVSETKFRFDGVGADGPLEGKSLPPLVVSQELWHSAERFQPGVDRYEPPE